MLDSRYDGDIGVINHIMKRILSNNSQLFDCLLHVTWDLHFTSKTTQGKSSVRLLEILLCK